MKVCTSGVPGPEMINTGIETFRAQADTCMSLSLIKGISSFKMAAEEAWNCWE